MSSSYSRREIVAALAATAAWPLAARAQPARMRRIGLLSSYAEGSPLGLELVAAFRDGLRKLGWEEGHNIHIEYRWAGTERERMQRYAKELVTLRPEIILTASSPTTAVLLQETRTIPVVFANLVDPVGQGFVASLARPGGNATGFVNLDTSTAGKWIELLKEIAPRVTRAAIPYHPATAPYFESYLAPFRAAGASLGLEVSAAPIRDMAEFETFIGVQERAGNGGLIPVPSGFMSGHAAEITSLANRYRLPAVYNDRVYADAGGLLSYGSDLGDNYRRSSSYVDRILKGEKPSDLPVQFPVKFELVINLNTAKTLGIEVPWFLQQRADAIIE